MATPVPRSLLALLAFLHLLITCTTTADDLLARSPPMDTLPPHASVPFLGPDEPTTPTGRPASSNLLGASPSASTFSGVSQQRLLDASVIAREDNATAPATTATTAPTTTTPPSPRVRCVHIHTRDAAATAADGILQTPPPGASGTTAPSNMAAVLKALPLLAIPFLPPPVAALVALSSLATPVGACSDPEPSDDSDCSGSGAGLAHATCTVYRYAHGSGGSIDRARPFADLRAVCPHPLCNAGSDERALSTAYGLRRGRRYDPFHGYCTVNTLVVGVVPGTGDRCICSVGVHLPVADPAGVVAAGGDVCYVELEHMNYREGYYILCPVRDCSHEPVVCCTEFPHDAIAAAVWDHRRLVYRHAVGWYSNDTTASLQFDGEVYRYGGTTTSFDHLRQPSSPSDFISPWYFFQFCIDHPESQFG